jgi:hypothetical protein
MAEQVHDLKTWPEYFDAVASGVKTFEIRRDDGRRFEVGDVLRLREWRPGRVNWPKATWGVYTGREVRVRVTFALRGPAFGVERGFVALAIAREVPEAAPLALVVGQAGPELVQAAAHG